MTRREFSTALLTVPAAAAIDKQFRLIAHRGGVVDSGRPENSPAALQSAIDRGYWMVEVDVRRTRDGEPVLYHDNTLQKYFSESRAVEELSWAELRNLRSNPGGRPPLHFAEACAMCNGRARLMLDLKNKWEPAFYQRLLRHMEDNRVPDPIWSLGGPAVRPLFDGKVMVSVNRNSLRAALDAGEPVAERYFLFELGSELRTAAGQQAVQLARKHGIPAVAAINTFRYTMAKRDEWEGPKEDVAALRAGGVKYYQIDSRYEPLFA
jgi:glycerophosphoryl diester phosphodiesterase